MGERCGFPELEAALIRLAVSLRYTADRDVVLDALYTPRRARWPGVVYRLPPMHQRSNWPHDRTGATWSTTAGFQTAERW
jgi:hypothetical protein